MVISLVAYNYSFKKNNVRIVFDLNNKNYNLLEERDYLNRCLGYSLLLKPEVLNSLESYNIVVFFMGESCSTCLEDLLLNFKKHKLKQDKILVLTDNIRKLDIILNFNDGFQTNFRYKSDTIKYFYKSVNDVIIIENKQNHIINLLEYRPENEELFNKHLFN